MAHVVGTGCMAASVIGTFAGAAPDRVTAAAAAGLSCYEIAAELAAEDMRRARDLQASISSTGSIISRPSEVATRAEGIGMKGYYFITDEALSAAGVMSDVRQAVAAGARDHPVPEQDRGHAPPLRGGAAHPRDLRRDAVAAHHQRPDRHRARGRCGRRAHRERGPSLRGGAPPPRAGTRSSA